MSEYHRIELYDQVFCDVSKTDLVLILKVRDLLVFYLEYYYVL